MTDKPDLDAIEAEIEAEIGRAGKQGPVPKALFDARALTAALRAAREEIDQFKQERRAEKEASRQRDYERQAADGDYP